MSRSDRDTSSNDPKMVACRVFVGRLPTDKMEKEELENIFSKHGRIAVSLFKGFGFVQYENEKDAHRAIAAENGSLIKGNKIVCNLASDRKKDGGSSSGSGAPLQMVQQHGQVQNGGMKRDRSFEVDDSLARRPHLEEKSVEPFPAPRPREVGVDRPFDCVIIVCQKNSKTYAEYIERRLLELNLTIDMIFLIHEGALEKAVDDMTRRGVLYIVIVMPQHEVHRSITIHILHGVSQEHRNMPLEDALVMLARNFNLYVSNLRIGSEQPSIGFLLNLVADGKHLSVAELDRIITHLCDRRDKLIEAEGGKPPPRGLTAAAASAGGNYGTVAAASFNQPPPPPISSAAAGVNLNAPIGVNNPELSQKILSLLGGQGNPASILGALGGVGGIGLASNPLLQQAQQQLSASSGTATSLASLVQQYGITLNQGGAAGLGGGNMPAQKSLLQTPPSLSLPAAQPQQQQQQQQQQALLAGLAGAGGAAALNSVLESYGINAATLGAQANMDPTLRKALDNLLSMRGGPPGALGQSPSLLGGGPGLGGVSIGGLQQPGQQSLASSQLSQAFGSGQQAQGLKPAFSQQQQQLGGGGGQSQQSIIGSISSFLSSQQQAPQASASMIQPFGGGAAKQQQLYGSGGAASILGTAPPPPPSDQSLQRATQGGLLGSGGGLQQQQGYNQQQQPSQINTLVSGYGGQQQGYMSSRQQQQQYR